LVAFFPFFGFSQITLPMQIAKLCYKKSFNLFYTRQNSTDVRSRVKSAAWQRDVLLSTTAGNHCRQTVQTIFSNAKM
jgi:hypothetical protein